jgi:hypothetical protein
MIRMRLSVGEEALLLTRGSDKIVALAVCRCLSTTRFDAAICAVDLNEVVTFRCELSTDCETSGKELD